MCARVRISSGLPIPCCNLYRFARCGNCFCKFLLEFPLQSLQRAARKKLKRGRLWVFHLLDPYLRYLCAEGTRSAKPTSIFAQAKSTAFPRFALLKNSTCFPVISFAPSFFNWVIWFSLNPVTPLIFIPKHDGVRPRVKTQSLNHKFQIIAVPSRLPVARHTP